MKTQTQSTPPPAPSTPESTPQAPKPTESKLPYHIFQFGDLIQTLQDSLDNAAPPPPSAPEYAQYVDNQTFLQQCLLVDHLKLVLQTDGLDHRTISNLRQTLALIEKTRARHERKDKAAHQSAPEQPERDEARTFLLTELSGGERSAKELIALARSIGITHRTLKRAKAEMNIASVQRIHDKERRWHWSLPQSISSTPAEPAAAASVSAPTAQDTTTAPVSMQQSAAAPAAPSKSS